MDKKIIAILIAGTCFSGVANAQKITNALDVDAYGKLGMSYVDGDFYYETSHLNVDSELKLSKKHKLNLNLGARAHQDKIGDYEYNFFIDEAYYNFVENESADLKLGRFYNPVGLHGESQYDYFEHLFEIEGNQVKSIDGIGLGYKAKLQKDVYIIFDAFLGTVLTDQVINGVEVDLDTSLNYGANAKFTSRLGDLNFGFYGSNNGKDLSINGSSVGIPDEPVFYQTNVGYEFDSKTWYALVEWNRYDYNFNDDIDSTYQTIDTALGYTFGHFTPMIGYSIQDGENYLGLGDVDRSIIKAGVRADINKNLALNVSYSDIDDSLAPSDSVIAADLLFKF